MANRLLPCPRCAHPQLLVPGVKAGICAGCRKPYTVEASALAPAAGPTWKDCEAAGYIGDTWSFRGKNYTFFGGVTWHDATYDCQSHELFLIDDAEDEVSLEFEEDDEGQVVWWLDTDATGRVERQPDGSVKYENGTYRPHNPAPNVYTVVTQVGAMDEPYDVAEAKSVRWYTDWTGDLGRRSSRLGYTRELGQDTWFWMAPVAAPVRRTNLQFDAARRQAWARRNYPLLFGTIGAILLALFLSIFSSARALNKLSYDSGPLNAPAQKHWISDAFLLEGKQSNVKANVEVRGMGGWFDATLCLANLETQRRYCTVVEVDGDSKWTGAAWADDRFFSSVPPGRYVLEGQAEMDATTPVEFHVRLVRDAPRRTNFWWTLAVLLAGPLLFVAAQAGRKQMAGQSMGQVAQTVFVLLLIAFFIWVDWIS